MTTDFTKNSTDILETHIFGVIAPFGYGNFLRDLGYNIAKEQGALAQSELTLIKSGKPDIAGSTNEDNGGPTWDRTRDQPVMSRRLYR